MAIFKKIMTILRYIQAVTFVLSEQTNPHVRVCYRVEIFIKIHRIAQLNFCILTLNSNQKITI